MKLVITTDCFLPRWDGIARFLNELLPELGEWEIVVFAPQFDGVPELPSNVTLIRFPLIRWRFGDIYFARPDRKEMKAHIKSADVVFNQTIGPIGRLGVLLADKYKKRVVSFVHSVEWKLVALAIKRFRALAGWMVKRRARRLYNKCSLLLVPSHEVADLLSRNKVVARKEVVHLGVDVNDFVPPHSRAVAKRKIGIKPDMPVVGFSGRIAREKDLPTLLKAFQRVRKQIDARLLVVGEGLEHEIPASKTVLRVGHQDEVVPFLQAMDVFVLPSLTETTSLATMEAMACGVPPIVTPVGNLREYIVDGENGLVFSSGDVNALAEKLRLLLANDSLRMKMGRAARKTIVDNYSWKPAVRKIRDALMH